MGYISKEHATSRNLSMFHVLYLCSVILSCCVQMEKQGLKPDSQYCVHHISRVLQYCLSEHFDLIGDKRKDIMQKLDVADRFKNLQDVTVKKVAGKTALHLI
jgi:hypothetical protein